MKLKQFAATAKAWVGFVVTLAASFGIDGSTQLKDVGKKLVAAAVVLLGVYVVPNKQD